MPKLLIFDSDGVLVSDFDRRAYKKFVKGFLLKHGAIKRGASKRESDRIAEKQDRLWKAVEGGALVGRISHRKANEAWIAKLGMKKSLAKAFVDADRGFWERRIKALPEVRDTLGKLRARGCKLAVLSNDVRQGFMKRRLLARAGVAGRVDHVYTSHSIGHMKPEREAYLHIARVFRAKPGETVFVWHEDYELKGAKRAGMRVVCFGRKPSRHADASIRRFSQLLGVVQLR